MTGGAQDSGVEDLRHRLNMIVSHATGGALQYDPAMSVNDICVEITRMRNKVWEHAQESLLDSLTPRPATPAPAGWQPRIGEEVRVSQETAERWPDWRDTRLWVVGVSMDRNVSGTPTEGLNVCVSDEWPVTNRTGGFTDGFFINRPYAGDDLRPIPTAPAEGGDHG